MNTRPPSGLAPSHAGGPALSQCGCAEGLGGQSAPSCRNSPPHFLLSLPLSVPGSLGVWRLALFLNSFPPGHRPVQVLHAQSGGQERHTLSCSSVCLTGWHGGAASGRSAQQSYCANNGAVGLPCKQMAPSLTGVCAASSPHSLKGRGPLFLKPLPSAPLSTHVTGLPAGLMLRKSAVGQRLSGAIQRTCPLPGFSTVPDRI